MKKLTSVLLSVVMLMSVLCMPALADGENSYLQATAHVDDNGMVVVEVKNTEATTNGKFAVDYEFGPLAYIHSDIEGMIADATVDRTAVTVYYATTTTKMIEAGTTIATLWFTPMDQGCTTTLTVRILEFNAHENLDIELPAIEVSLPGSTPSIPDLPVNPNPPVDPDPQPPVDPDDGKDDGKDDNKDDETKPGINIDVPELTEEKYNSIVAKYPDAEDHWAEEAIVKAVNAGLFNGTGENTFTPNGNVTRGMFAELLYRLSGKPAVDNDMPFSDVASNQYYYNAIIWAYSNGIVNGVSDTEFAPDAKVSREQMVTMLYRYAKFINDDVSASASLKGFADSDSVNTWAAEAMSWAVAEGIITGAGGKLSPADNSTRAQVATILVRYAGL